MKRIKWALALVLILGLVLPNAASADRGHWHGGHGGHASIGVFVGAPLYWGWPGPYYGYPPPYYAYSPPVVVAPSPPVYVERGDDEGAPPRSSKNYWYYCDRPAGYYPYVKECPGGWQRVAPTPPR